MVGVPQVSVLTPELRPTSASGHHDGRGLHQRAIAARWLMRCSSPVTVAQIVPDSYRIPIGFLRPAARVVQPHCPRWRAGWGNPSAIASAGRRRPCTSWAPRIRFAVGSSRRGAGRRRPRRRV